MTHALDLPEIRGHIAQFLNPYDLTVCSRVSKDWNQACLPFLWRELKIGRRSRNSSGSSGITGILYKTSIRRHSHRLRVLTPDNFSCSAVEPSQATDVRDVYFQNLEVLHWSACPHDQARFIRPHRLTLVRLDLSCRAIQSEGAQRDSEKLWPVLAACPNLKSLEIDEVCVSHTSWPLCWSLWSRLTHLGMTRIDFSAIFTAGASKKSKNTLRKQPAGLQEWLSQASPCPQPLRIKKLEISQPYEMRRLEDELAFLKCCPDLETLIWWDSGKSYAPNLLAQYLAEQTRHCPKLVDVSFHETSRAEIVVPFLETRVGLPLQALSDVSIFGQAAWDLTRTKYTTSLRSLKLWDTSIPAGLAHDMLCSLPSLVTASMSFVSDQDFTTDPRPWVCLGLKRLELGVSIDGDPLEIHHLIMKRLGTLTSLNCLGVFAGGCNPLQFQLRSGLGHLATLQMLQELHFCSAQSLEEDDARWMVDNWPWFHLIRGRFSSDPIMYSSLEGIFKEGGVNIGFPNDAVLIR